MHAVQRDAIELFRRIRGAEVAQREQRIALVEEALALWFPAVAGPGIAALATAQTDDQRALAAVAREQFDVDLPVPWRQRFGIEAFHHPPHVRGQ